jgi:hypothetical protein
MLSSDVHWVSPRIKKADLPATLTLNDKISVFEDRVLGWQLDIAEQLYFGAPAKRGKKRLQVRIEHNGFAVLYILLSYFEMTPKYEAGDLSEDSGIWFKRGIKSVFPELAGAGQAAETSILSAMWKGARNELYHSAMTKKRVFVSGDANCLDFDAAKKRLVVNPGAVARRTITHFNDYVARLRNPSNTTLRSNFEKKFNDEILPQIS